MKTESHNCIEIDFTSLIKNFLFFLEKDNFYTISLYLITSSHFHISFISLLFIIRFILFKIVEL